MCVCVYIYIYKIYINIFLEFLECMVVYRILLTISVTVASAERSFSKLKLIKSYLRSTMSQERLNELAILSIEKELVEKLDYVNLIIHLRLKTRDV